MKTEDDVRRAERLLTSYHTALGLFNVMVNADRVGVSLKAYGSYYTFVDLNDPALTKSETLASELARLEGDAPQIAIHKIAVSVHNKVLSEIAGLIHHYKRELLKLGVSTDAPLPAPVASYEITENPNETIAEE